MSPLVNVIPDPTPKSDALATVASGLEPESATALRATFDSLFAQAEEWTARAREIRVTDITQKREMKLARESRLALREIRVKAEHARKRLKEDSVRRGRAIDGMANIIKALVEPIEEHLLEQETFAERHEARRKDELRTAREEALRALGTDPRSYANLGETDEETWAITLQTAKDARDARVRAEKEAEEVRIEAERIAAQKREAERKEKARLEAERIEREKAQAEENARLKRERDELEAQRATERAAARAETERVERELAAERAKAEAERKAAEEHRLAAEAEARAAALAPDREKLRAFAVALRGLPVPELTTEAGVKARSTLEAQLEKFARWVEKTGAEL